MIDENKMIGILNMDALYGTKHIRFTPLKDGGLEGDEDHAFTVNGDGEPWLLNFDEDCVTLVESNEAVVRFDPRNYRTTILPVPAEFAWSDTAPGNVDVRYYRIPNTDDNAGLIDVKAYNHVNLDGDDDHPDDDLHEYQYHLVLETSHGQVLIGETGVTDRELLRMAGYTIVGKAGDETGKDGDQ